MMPDARDRCVCVSVPAGWARGAARVRRSRLGYSGGAIAGGLVCLAGSFLWYLLAGGRWPGLKKPASCCFRLPAAAAAADADADAAVAVAAVSLLFFFPLLIRPISVSQVGRRSGEGASLAAFRRPCMQRASVSSAWSSFSALQTRSRPTALARCARLPRGALGAACVLVRTDAGVKQGDPFQAQWKGAAESAWRALWRFAVWCSRQR